MKSRILFYSHDTFGLGHIRRTQKIANSLANTDRSILIACSSPKANEFSSRPGIEFLNLPGFTKLQSGDYKPRNLNIQLEEFVKLRSHLLLSTAMSFQPDVFVVDKEPLGVKKELLPTLEYLRTTNCKIVCGYRDILDSHDAVHKEWEKRGTVDALTNFYDEIFVYGEKSIFNFSQEYNLPEHVSQKVKYTGYIPPAKDWDRGRQSFHDLFVDEKENEVLVTMGGGGDGAPFLLPIFGAIDRGLWDWKTKIVSGPFASQEIKNLGYQIAEKHSNIEFTDFTTSIVDDYLNAKLVVCMGGYNTVTELLNLGVFPLVLPRTTPRLEQMIRAKVMREHGLLDYLSPEKITARSLSEKVSQLLELGLKREHGLDARGLETISHLIKELETKSPTAGDSGVFVPAN